MKNSGKKQKEIRAKIDPTKKYSVDEAMQLVQDGATASYDETVDVSIRLGIDPKQSDQQVRGAVVLPNGLGKKVRVLAMVKPDKEAEATEAGADLIGTDEIIEKIKGGWFDFEAVVATPDMMASVSKIGKVLGPRGLMPNPKLGTVTFDIKKAIQDCKSGKSEFRNEKAGIVQASIGKVSFGAEKLKGNFTALMGTVFKLKPQKAKGTYIKSLSLSSTMGPGVDVDVAEVTKLAS